MEKVITITFFESKHKKQKKIFFYLYVIMITFRALEEFVKEKLPAFGDENVIKFQVLSYRDYKS